MKCSAWGDETRNFFRGEFDERRKFTILSLATSNFRAHSFAICGLFLRHVLFAVFFDLNVELCVELRLNRSRYALVFAVVEQHVLARRLSCRFRNEKERHAHHDHAVRSAFVLNKAETRETWVKLIYYETIQLFSEIMKVRRTVGWHTDQNHY